MQRGEDPEKEQQDGEANPQPAFSRLDPTGWGREARSANLIFGSTPEGRKADGADFDLFNIPYTNHLEAAPRAQDMRLGL